MKKGTKEQEPPSFMAFHAFISFYLEYCCLRDKSCAFF